MQAKQSCMKVVSILGDGEGGEMCYGFDRKLEVLVQAQSRMLQRLGYRIILTIVGQELCGQGAALGMECHSKCF